MAVFVCKKNEIRILDPSLESKSYFKRNPLFSARVVIQGLLDSHSIVEEGEGRRKGGIRLKERKGGGRKAGCVSWHLHCELWELPHMTSRRSWEPFFLPAAEQVYKSFFFSFSFIIIFNLQIFLLMTRLCVSRGRQISREVKFPGKSNFPGKQISGKLNLPGNQISRGSQIG